MGSPRFEVYQGKDKGWYWRYVAANGEEMFKSSEGYSSYFNACRALERARRAMPEVPVQDADEPDEEKPEGYEGGVLDGGFGRDIEPG